MAPPPSTLNPPSPHTPYFTPHHPSTPGAPYALTPSTPTLFTPLTIRSLTLRNRIIVAPMCQYSTSHTGPSIGALTDYHIATLGHYALKGAAMVFIEATGVQLNGRISPNCPGLWSDDQIPGVRRVADFIKSQGSLCGIQLAHAGRKASTIAGWVGSPYRKEKGWGPGSVRADRDVGGWPEDVVGPMGGVEESWDGKGLEEEDQGGYWPPRALTAGEIGELVADWGRSAVRAVRAGVDVIEIHAAHGYLLHQFLSPVTNRRTDKYGGSFENRTRLLREIIVEIRHNIPATMPLFLRVSNTEWLEDTETEKTIGKGESWTIEQTIRLAKDLTDMGVDLLDVSSGGNYPTQKVDMFKSKDYQVNAAKRIRAEVKKEGKNLLIGAVGLITEAEQAKSIVESGTSTPQTNGVDAENPGIAEEARIAKEMTQSSSNGEPMADVVLVARQFMREPEWVLKTAHQLGVDVAWPAQFLRVRFPKL